MTNEQRIAFFRERLGEQLQGLIDEGEFTKDTPLSQVIGKLTQDKGGYINKHGSSNTCGEIDMQGRDLDRNIRPGQTDDDSIPEST